jgi:hypothetical protein
MKETCRYIQLYILETSFLLLELKKVVFFANATTALNLSQSQKSNPDNKVLVLQYLCFVAMAGLGLNTEGSGQAWASYFGLGLLRALKKL